MTRAATRAATGDATGDAAGLYVYAIVPHGLDPATLGVGIDAAALEVVAVSEGIAAVAHRHDAAPYAGSGRDAERRVLEHGNVVERCWARAGTVLPLGLNVIVTPGETESARERLAQWLRANAAALSERLSALEGRVELRVEISLDGREAASGSEESRRLGAELAERPAGVQRLLARKLAALATEAAEERADRLYPEYRRRVAALSEDLTENLRGHPPEGFLTVLNVSVLARRDDVPRLGQALSDIEAEEPAVRVRFLGPWPPFSFADVPGASPVEPELGGP